MYKIYINETPLILCHTEEVYTSGKGLDKVLVNVFSGKSKHILQVVDMLEKTDRWQAVILHDEDVKRLWKAFKSLFRIIKAAGGLVENPKGEVLFIYRKGHWDLPKGKIDDGESKKKAAVREVMEETGLQQVSRGKRITRTFHTYRLPDGTRVLKYTYWYAMLSADETPKPQIEEEITEAVWKAWPESRHSLKPMYKNIGIVLDAHFSH